jgi:hypothetical protein
MKYKVTRTSWLIAWLTIPIELVLAIPTFLVWKQMGIVGSQRSGPYADYLGFTGLLFVIGLFGLIGLVVLILGSIRAHKLGELPGNKLLLAVFALAMLFAAVQAYGLFAGPRG